MKDTVTQILLCAGLFRMKNNKNRKMFLMISDFFVNIHKLFLL